MKLWQRNAIAMLLAGCTAMMAAQEGYAKAENFKCQIAAAFRVRGPQSNSRWVGAEADRAALDWIPHSGGCQRTYVVLL